MNFVYALRFLSISYRLEKGGDAPKIKDEANLRSMVNAHKWDELASKLGNKDSAYTISRIFLARSLS